MLGIQKVVRACLIQSKLVQVSKNFGDIVQHKIQEQNTIMQFKDEMKQE